jgi:hypothetical protein
MEDNELKTLIQQAIKAISEDRCSICMKPVAQEADWDVYAPEEGQHLCWEEGTYPHYIPDDMKPLEELQAEAVLDMLRKNGLVGNEEVQVWNGVVETVVEPFKGIGTVTAEMTEQNGSVEPLLMDFDLSAFSSNNVQVGDVIRLIVRTVTNLQGEVTTTSELLVVDTGTWTQKEIDSIKERAQERLNALLGT